MPPDTKRSFVYASRGPQDTQSLGARLGELAAPGDVLLLLGRLGAGKTCLVQGLARGLGVEDYVPSPTFVLMREYKGRLPLYHVDLYRLENAAEIADLGLDDYFYGEGVSVVEWADRAMQLLPPEHLLVEIIFQSTNQRRIHMEAAGKRHGELLSRLHNAIHSLPGGR